MKKTVARVKLRVAAGKVSPTPAIASSLGPKGVNLMQFCKKCNEVTANCPPGQLVRAMVSLFEDKTFDINIKGTPVSDIIKSAVNVTKGASAPGKQSVGIINYNKLEELAKNNMGFMNTRDISAAVRMLEGTAKSMGLKIEGSAA